MYLHPFSYFVIKIIIFENYYWYKILNLNGEINFLKNVGTLIIINTIGILTHRIIYIAMILISSRFNRVKFNILTFFTIQIFHLLRVLHIHSISYFLWLWNVFRRPHIFLMVNLNNLFFSPWTFRASWGMAAGAKK